MNTHIISWMEITNLLKRSLQQTFTRAYLFAVLCGSAITTLAVIGCRLSHCYYAQLNSAVSMLIQSIFLTLIIGFLEYLFCRYQFSVLRTNNPQLIGSAQNLITGFFKQTLIVDGAIALYLTFTTGLVVGYLKLMSIVPSMFSGAVMTLYAAVSWYLAFVSISYLFLAKPICIDTHNNLLKTMHLGKALLTGNRLKVFFLCMLFEPFKNLVHTLAYFGDSIWQGHAFSCPTGFALLGVVAAGSFISILTMAFISIFKVYLYVYLKSLHLEQ
jgi:hypothetical protein